jgi:hypothetical protein
MVNKHWWKMLLFLLAMAGVLLGGVLCCLIGIFIAAPVAIAAFMYAYEDIFGTWSPANPMASQSVPAAPAYGPAGTMVVPNAGGTPPPIAGATPPPADGGHNESVKPSRATFALVTGFLLLLAVLSGLVVFSLIMHAERSRNTSRVSLAPSAAPEPPEAPQLAIESAPPADVDTGDYNSLVNRTRQELEKISARFDQLQVASSSDSNLVVSFTGLHIGVNEEQTNFSHSIDGTLMGTRRGVSDWQFAGTGKLAAAQFEMAGLELKDLLVPPTVRSPSRENLTERLAATETITDESIKDKSFTSLAEDAAKAGETEIVKSALGEMVDDNQRDAAAHESALLLAKAGFRKQAIETAKGISDPNIHDKTLAELAQ